MQSRPFVSCSSQKHTLVEESEHRSSGELKENLEDHLVRPLMENYKPNMNAIDVFGTTSSRN